MSRFKHGESQSTPEYRAWNRIKEKCFSKTCKYYHNYGGRGITMCKRWLNSYELFLQDMGRRPSDKYSIDRINNDGNYEPENCRWATSKEQNSNTRRNILLEHNGIIKTRQAWSDEIGVHYMYVKYHLKTKTISEVIDYYKNKNYGRQ